MPAAAEKAPKGQAGAAPGVFVDPFRTFNFKLMILGITEAHFTQCSGIGVNIDSIRYVEGGSSVEHKIPGQAHYDPVTLRYGFTESKELWNWVMSAVKQPVQRKDVQVLILDADGITEKVRFTLRKAWPCKFKAAELNAMASGVAILELDLCHEELVRQ